MSRCSGMLMGMVIAVGVGGCASPYRLQGTAATYQPIKRLSMVTRDGPAAVEVLVDRRPEHEKDRFCLGNWIIEDSDWAQPVPRALSSILRSELESGHYFANFTGDSQKARVRVGLVLDRFIATWHGGTWSYLWPFKDMTVSAHVDLTVIVLDGSGRRKFRQRFKKSLERVVENYENGNRHAAALLGEALREVFTKVLERLDQRM